jgi:hypothetical protein
MVNIKPGIGLAAKPAFSPTRCVSVLYFLLLLLSGATLLYL